MKVPITRPDIGELEAREASRVVISGWVTQGPEVAAFERELAEVVGAKHAVAVSNCTVALELALRVLGVKPGDEVVTVSHSFIATANAVTSVGALPVFCDVEDDTYGMDPRSLERAIGPKTRAIMCVHQIGMPCDLAGVLEVARRHNLPVVEDAACAIGSEVRMNGRFERVGRPHGTIACFSFHPRKVVTTGDGGVLTTNDAAIDARLRLLRQHAMSVPDTIRHHSDKVIFEEYVEPAFNYRMTDLQAAVGRPQLRRLAETVAERRRLADRYVAALADNPMFATPTERDGIKSNWQSYALRMKPGAHRSQVEILQALMDRGIAAKRGIMNAHQTAAYANPKSYRCVEGGLPVSERIRDESIVIPLFHGMTREEQDYVIESLVAVAAR